MPTNLPPKCTEHKAHYRVATSIREEVACLKGLLGCIPNHNANVHLCADLRRRVTGLVELEASTRFRKGGITGAISAPTKSTVKSTNPKEVLRCLQSALPYPDASF